MKEILIVQRQKITVEARQIHHKTIFQGGFYQSINRVRQDSAKLYPEACTVQNVVNKNCTVRTAVITTPCEMS